MIKNLKKFFGGNAGLVFCFCLGIILGLSISCFSFLVRYSNDLHCANLPIVAGFGNMNLYANRENEFVFFNQHYPIVSYLASERNETRKTMLVCFPDTHDPACTVTFDPTEKKITRCEFFSPDHSTDAYSYIDRDGDGFFDLLASNSNFSCSLFCK